MFGEESLVNRHNVTMEISAASMKQVPNTDLPQVALAGKSNVGKSSLINALLNRINFARTSSTPGKTQTINFYNVDKKLYLADLPGYGYTKTGKHTMMGFSGLIDTYLKEAPQLAMIVLLIDIRHEPSANDLMMLDFIRKLHYKPVIVLTKRDKLSNNEATKNISMIKKKLELKKGEILLTFSSTKKIGVEELWNVIEGVLDQDACEEEDEED
ncbi:MAG: ribosome biogenesis GTP-binding protein YihA/YsxC [Clostridia bacterium]|nr:ribosome biogenesis GTP-binding protein YihA/YsxC [Clostridia bacterium]